MKKLVHLWKEMWHFNSVQIERESFCRSMEEMRFAALSFFLSNSLKRTGHI